MVHSTGIVFKWFTPLGLFLSGSLHWDCFKWFTPLYKLTLGKVSFLVYNIYGSTVFYSITIFVPAGHMFDAKESCISHNVVVM